MRSAMEKYRMIDDGDVVAVGVSGGKDSVALLTALARMRAFYPKKYDVKAITIDPCFLNKQTDYSQIEELCKELNVEYRIKRTKLYNVVFEEYKQKNPCSLCAKMRRGLLHNMALEAGCNKIALGHHMDDASQTFLMNLLNNGTIGCFSPVSYLSRKNLYLIRPMIFVREKDIIRAVKKEGLPVIKSACPADGTTQREKTKNLISGLDREYNNLSARIIGAMQKGHISGW
jgi:tRNA(Ile)-lysidine synthetase-like protein